MPGDLVAARAAHAARATGAHATARATAAGRGARAAGRGARAARRRRCRRGGCGRVRVIATSAEGGHRNKRNHTNNNQHYRNNPDRQK